MDPKFSDRLYLVNNAPGKQSSKGSQSVWNNPVGGAIEWDENSNVFIIPRVKSDSILITIN